MKQLITAVDNGSIAEELNICAGDSLVSINGEAIVDVIDYEQLCSAERLNMVVQRRDGSDIELDIEKDEYEPLGLSFGSGLMSHIRSCKNHCIFCFIDQMPHGVRDTLHVKDDDWRLSLIMGNYVTLTNVDDAEFERILKRRVSPLYVSVHSTDGALRARMMANPTAVRIMERLTALKDAGLRFHAQIVVCPEINDGQALKSTLDDLYGLYPACASVALVPVGLTKYRDKLYPLRRMSVDELRAMIALCGEYQQKAMKEHGERFVYAADEAYLGAGLELPAFDEYGDFDQLENGVGLLRQFEDGFMYALEEFKPKGRMRFASASGVAAAPFMRELFKKLSRYGVDIDVHAVQNEYFGHDVTVSGLITGGDLVNALSGACGDAVLIPHTMLREGGDVFLDGMTLDSAMASLNKKIIPVSAADGEAFVRELGELLR